MATITHTPQTRIEQPQEPGTLQRFLWNFTDTFVVARRNLMRYVRIPQLLVFSSFQPIMFVLLFNYVFGGAIETGAGDYINYLLPGILVQTVIFGATQTTVGLADDLSKGMIDRFRSLPMARSAVLAGRTLADTIRNLFVVILMLIVGYIIGFRFQNGILPAVGAVALIVLFGHAFSWISAFIGLLVKDPETAQVAGFVWVFPLVFASSIFVPTATMPDGLRVFAENQPISIIVNEVRDLVLGEPEAPPAIASDQNTPSLDAENMPADVDPSAMPQDTSASPMGGGGIPTREEGSLLAALAWIIGIMAVFVPLSIWQYRRIT